MELPPYHAPRVRFVFGEAWRRLLVFVRRAGVTITVIVTVLAALNTFGAGTADESSGDRETLLSVIGKGITPVFGPMGIEQDNWPATVGLFTGIFAKEAVIGALSSLYGQNEVELDGETGVGASLVEAVRTIPENLSGVLGGLADPLGIGVVGADETAVAEEVGADAALLTRLRRRFSGPAAYAYLLFVLIYFPCVAALAAAIREMGPSLGWVLAAYSTLIAWIVATLYYQLATGPAIVPVVLAVGLLALVVGALAVLGRTIYRPDRLRGAT
jgi:ferrous iron transport protein B